MDILCTADMCPVILNSTCVFYEGNNLTYTGINTNDSLQTALQKIDAKFGNAMVGYIFTNGVVQLSPGQPVKLGGSLIENTTIGGNFTLSFVGPIIGSKLATAGGTASEFLKGDGTLDNTPYQVAGAYITNLSGDVVASGPGTAVATLASVNANPGTYGDGTHVPRITVDSKGRVTAVTSTAISLPSSVLSFTGDVYGSGSTGSTTTLTLNDVNLNVYNSNTFLKFKVNAKGLVTGATPVTGLDINSALGFTPVTQARTLTINGVTYDLSANRSWTVSGGGGGGSVDSVTASAPLASSGGANPNITISQASTSTDGYLSSTDWNTFNSKQAAGSYITDLTGEASASGPGSANVTLSNSAVIGKVLTGVNITGGTVVATDTILEAFGKVQNQINGLIGGSIYKGTWNASTNTPTITSGVGTTGWYYIVSVPGSTNIDGITDWNLGDWIIFDGTAWQQVDNTDAVVSVNGQTGAVSLTTDNVPEGSVNLYYTPARSRTAISLTTTGTSGAATYDNITGVLNIPNYASTSGTYVPYTGATTNVNLGEYGITTGYVAFDLTPTGTPTGVGTMYWDPFYRTVSMIDGDGDTTLQIGQEERLLIHNNTGATLTDGQVVYVTGSTGELPSVSLADASSESTSAATLGVVTESILNGADGFVTVSGIVHGLNTLAYNEGDLLWLSETAGQFTNVKPISPAHLVLIGYVIKKAGGNGSILVKIQNTQELAESSDVLISNPEVDGQGLFLQTISGVQLWRNRTIADVLGYTPANAAITISTTAPLQGGGDLSANRTFSITQSTTSTDGYLSSTDWNTFNGKQAGSANLTSLATLAYVSESFVKMTGANTFALDTTVYYPASNPNGYTSNTGTVTSVAALTIGTAGTDISSSVANGTTTPVITLNIPTASATNRGALSAADWATFNSKQNAFTGTTNYIPKFTGTSTIGNSIMYNGAAGIGINTATPRASLDVVGNIYSNDIWIQDNYNLLFGDLTAGASSTYIYGVGGSGTNYLGFATNGSEAARILASRQLKLNAYTSTSSFTGTAAGYLAFDSSGNILSVAAPSGGVTGSGTTGYLTKFTGSTAVGNSIMSESGTTVTVAGNISVTASGGNGVNTGVISRDVTAARSSNTGVIYLGSDGAHYLYFDSANYQLPTGGLYVGGLVSCTSLTETSSERYKENIVTLDGSLNKVLNLRGVSYDRKDTKQKEIGVIAEEVEKIIPEVINYNENNQVDSVSYGRLTAILIEAIKEQQKQIDELKSLLGK